MRRPFSLKRPSGQAFHPFPSSSRACPGDPMLTRLSLVRRLLDAGTSPDMTVSRRTRALPRRVQAPGSCHISHLPKMRTAGHRAAGSYCSFRAASRHPALAAMIGPPQTASRGLAPPRGELSIGPPRLVRYPQAGSGLLYTGPSVRRHLGRRSPSPRDTDGLQLASSRTRDGCSLRRPRRAGISWGLRGAGD
jgi:hypothetical protein